MKSLIFPFLAASLLAIGGQALADDIQEIKLSAGQSTFVLTELQRYKITCEGTDKPTVLRSACFCAGTGYPFLTQRTLLSDGSTEDNDLGQYDSMDLCEGKLTEYTATICKPYVAEGSHPLK